MTNLEKQYTERRGRVLIPLAERLQELLISRFGQLGRIDRITVRAKTLERFITKAQKKNEAGALKYDEPMQQIQDQIGARIIIYYLQDVERVAKEVKKYLTFVEARQIIPESDTEFGYIGQHFILFFPKDLFDSQVSEEEAPAFFELQIKTLFQHAWSEGNHDLGYKPGTPLTSEQNRMLAFTAAQAWGADRIFAELFQNIEGHSTNTAG